MNIDQYQYGLIALTIRSVTLITIVALVRNAPVTLKMMFGKDKSLILQGSEPLSIPDKTKIDCLPGEANSQDCDK